MSSEVRHVLLAALLIGIACFASWLMLGPEPAESGTTLRTAPAVEPDIVRTTSGPYMIRGRVTFADGAPAPLCIVTASRGDDALNSFGMPLTNAATGADGRFRIPIEKAGTYVVEAVDLRFRVEQRDVTVNDAQPEATVGLTFAPRP